jgi:8-oxo-dGTP pyrophosphatase MutT (NUDIX family)
MRRKARGLAREAPVRYAINVIEDPDGRILLLQRSPVASLGAGLWGFSGGHIEAGESPAQCSQREIDEELGVLHAVELRGQIGPVRDSFYGGSLEIHLFHYLWHGGTIRLNDEHQRYAWVFKEDYRGYAVMDGIDEDIDYFGIWPRHFLNPQRLPRRDRDAPNSEGAGQ